MTNPYRKLAVVFALTLSAISFPFVNLSLYILYLRPSIESCEATALDRTFNRK